MTPVPFPLRLGLLTLLGLLCLPIGSWALPEVDVRSQTNASVTITAAKPLNNDDPPLVPQQLLIASMPCPRLGRIHALVTGRLHQTFPTHFEDFGTTFSITRNSTSHSSTARFYAAPEDVHDGGEQDVTLQHVATCSAGQTVTYRLLAHKARPDQPSPVLQDAILSLVYYASNSPDGG
jgi:hypothetical protein